MSAEWMASERGNAADLLRTHLMAMPPARCFTPPVASPYIPTGLIDIRRAAPTLVLLDTPPWSDAELRFLVRPEVADRLRKAAEILPSDLRLGFWEGLRPVPIQRSLWDSGLSYLRALYPETAAEKLEAELEHYVARPDGCVPPHSTGSAVDVAPVNAFGEVLTPADAWGKLAVDALHSALRDAGMAHYQTEWWHWSYGDEEWARAFDCSPLPFAETAPFDGLGGGI